jgi:hypothetical protein
MAGFSHYFREELQRVDRAVARNRGEPEPLLQSACRLPVSDHAVDACHGRSRRKSEGRLQK